MLSAQEARQLDRLAIGASAPPPAAGGAGHRYGAAPGHGVDFHDYRRYEPGDDPRRIDWAVAARHSQLVVRRFRVEARVRLHLLLDISRSMTLGAPVKLDCALKLAAALSYVAIARGDDVGLTTFDDEIRSHVPVRSGRAQLFRVLEALGAATGGRRSSLDRSLMAYGSVTQGPGLVVVLSDFFDADATWDGARFLLHRGLTPAFVQIVSDEELAPSIDDEVELIDIERPDASSVIVDASALVAYQARMHALSNRLSEFCFSNRLPWLRLVSSMPFDMMLAAGLRGGLLATFG
jgi:uncharacterized protein (DUF58 family)